MAGQLIFSEDTMINESIFQFEERLKSHVNKYIENGAILTTYFSQNENATTVDRGIQDIDKLFGKQSPLRFNQINNFPLYGFTQLTPDNIDEVQIEDINVEGDCIILPSTLVPKPYDFFMLNHLKMKALFQVGTVTYDSMKVEGYYKIHYRLISTSDETIQNLKDKVIRTYYTDLNAVGSDLNPIIQEDNFVLRKQIEQMVNQMITSYRALFYNPKHNCFLYHDNQTGLDYFDMCGNEFMAKYSLMNYPGCHQVVILHDKLRDNKFPLYYNNSVYNWIELGAPARLLQKFHYRLNDAESYPLSSFVQWGDNDIQIIQPIPLQEVGVNTVNSFFDEDQFSAYMNSNEMPLHYHEQLIWKYIHRVDQLTIQDVSLYLADTLLSSIYHRDVYLYTPIIIYIIREILSMN